MKNKMQMSIVKGTFLGMLLGGIFTTIGGAWPVIVGAASVLIAVGVLEQLDGGNRL